MSFDDEGPRTRPYPTEDYCGVPITQPQTYPHYARAIEAGLRIFPINRIENGLCNCGDAKCPAVGKHPIATAWQHTPDWSDEQVETMEMSGQLKTGYGVLVRGLLVIDVDSRNGGVASYKALMNVCSAVAGSGLIVNTGSGNGSKHLYFRVPDGLSLRQHHPDFPGLDFKSSGFVVGPGSLHKSGNLYTIGYGSFADIDDAPNCLIELLKKPDRHRSEVNGSVVDVSHADIADMLHSIPPDSPHEIWLRCGMATHHATEGSGFAIWDRWSSTGTKYPGSAALEARWHSFGKSANPTTIGTLMHYATEAGWKQSVTFESQADFGEADANPKSESENPKLDFSNTEDAPFDLSGIDLLRPPGFVGELTQWINGQCRYPRERLAVTSAIVAAGNIIGLRYIDERDRVTANIFAFCVAASGTGKESIQQSVATILRTANLHRAAHGSIKSEQEIVRNLTRHQASYYIVDEIGILLAKIENAKAKGGAAYLDGVIGILMQAYSKANSFMLLTGDMKEAVRIALVRELSLAKKAVEENEDKTGRIAAKIPGFERALSQVDNGLERPFISLVGFTTPVTFDQCLTADSANNGFIGRSILCRELETNPRARKGFRPPDPELPMSLAGTIQQLASGGHYDPLETRVECYDAPSRVPTDHAADDLLTRVALWLEDHAEHHKDATGFEAIVRRTYEHISKVSFILAAASGLRTAEHVRWATKFCIEDMNQKITKVFSNDSAKDKPARALQARILTLLSKQDGATAGTICNRIRGTKPEDVRKNLDVMVAKGVLALKTSTNPTNKRQVLTYFLA